MRDLEGRRRDAARRSPGRAPRFDPEEEIFLPEGLRAPFVDKLDVEILRRTAVGPFVPGPHDPKKTSASGLARSLKVSVETVRRRQRALQTSGLVPARVAWPNFRHLGLRAATYHFHIADGVRKGDVLRRVAALDRVIDVFSMMGPHMCVDLCYADEDDLARRISAIQAVTRGPPPAAFFEYPLPPPGRGLSRIDWRILAALRPDADLGLDDVATSVGVSRRTVKRRLDALLNRGALDIVAAFDPGRLEGQLLVYLLLRTRARAGSVETKAVVNAFKHRWVAQWSPPDASVGHVVLVLVAPSAGGAEEARLEAESLPQVERAEALVFDGAAADTEWIDREIASRAGPLRPRLTPVEVPRARAR